MSEIAGECEHCGAGYTPGSAYCSYCGNALPLLPGVPASSAAPQPLSPPWKKTAVSPKTGLSYEPYEGKWYFAPFVNRVRRYKVYKIHRAEMNRIERLALVEHENAVRLQAKKDAITAKYSRPGAIDPWYKKLPGVFMGFGQKWSEYGDRVQAREAAFKKRQEEERKRRTN